MASPNSLFFETPCDQAPRWRAARFAGTYRPVEEAPYGGGIPVGYEEVDIADGCGQCTESGSDWDIWAGDSARDILLQEAHGGVIGDAERAPS